MKGYSEEQRITASNLIKDIEAQRELMISVSTGGPRIDDVNEEYKNRRHFNILRLKELGIENPNPYKDLWEWYHRWSNGDMLTYRLRRSFLRDMFSQLIDELIAIESGASSRAYREPTGWPLVDRQLEKMRAQLARSEVEEDYQVVGLIARETIISLAQAVYDPSKHKTIDGVVPSNTDAKRMLEAFISSELAGKTNEHVRKYAKSALSLALALQHKRTANYQFAALCSEATASVVNSISIVTERKSDKAEKGQDT